MTRYSLALALAGLSFLITVIWGEPLIRILRHFKIGKEIRVEGPERHFSKLGTPTMGGVMIVLPVVLITILMNASSVIGVTSVLGRSIMLPMLVMLGYAVLGAIDDWEGMRGKRRGLGMRARTKFIIQWLLAIGTAWGLYYVLDVPNLYLPSFKNEIELSPLFYIPIAAFIIVSTSNAVNLTDGLDGLAGLITSTALATYGGIALLQGQVFIARFCFTVVGAIFGFLWFNVHPAMLFMGDTGSLALGATLGVVALMTGQWALLPVIAIIPLSTTLSDILQVGYFKLTGGKRLFKMAPLHHHFELSGWSETQIVQRFWLIGLIAALIGVALAVV
ncbi:MAG TPA: phospho-N-acetylmuramoyl-pentapeptide-transferase [Anaerolineales bacterium]|nr:phospho-N-acetylmuramoyl-pentapeptide-transferase [Anaerolineales bacterium]